VSDPQAKAPLQLSEAEFEARYSCDRLTATVLASRYRYLVKHMCTTLMTTAFSPVLRSSYDFSATLSGPADLGYPMSAVADSLLLFTGTMGDAVRNIVDEYGEDLLEPGDLLFCNDPYRKGTHVNDVCFVRPVWVDDEIAAYVTIVAHLMDMGGTVPGGFAATKRNVYENGLVIPPQLLYRGGEIVKPALSLVFDNARFGDLTLPDIRSIVTALGLGDRLLTEAVVQYGLPAHRGSLLYATDQGASAMSQAIERVPDGTYLGDDVLDCDGLDASREYDIKVSVRISGAHAEIDLSGTSEQARTCINAGWLDAKTAVTVALKFLLDPDTPYTSGVCRPIDIVLPAATIVSAEPPDGAIFSYWEATMPLVHAIMRALAGAVGESAIAGDFCSAMTHNATGTRDDGTPWTVVGGSCGGANGPWGASRAGDGENSLFTVLANGIVPSIEGLEVEAPVVVLRKDYVTDSGGAGEFRGGAANRTDTLWLTASEYHTTNLHTRYPSGFGVRGGGDGSHPAVWQWDLELERGVEAIGDSEADYAASLPIVGVVDPTTHVLDPDAGTYFHFGRKPVWDAPAGALMRYQTGGGGGWGDPLGRDPEMVVRDVRDEYVGERAAREVYGVVVKGDVSGDPAGLVVDGEETRRLRESLRSATERTTG